MKYTASNVPDYGHLVVQRDRAVFNGSSVGDLVTYSTNKGTAQSKQGVRHIPAQDLANMLNKSEPWVIFDESFEAGVNSNDSTKKLEKQHSDALSKKDKEYADAIAKLKDEHAKELKKVADAADKKIKSLEVEVTNLKEATKAK